MSADVPTSPGRFRKIWLALLAGNFLSISILLHLLFGVAATALVVQQIQSRKLTFKAGTAAPGGAAKVAEHKVQQARQKSTGGAPSMAKRVATTGLSKIALPEMPEMPTLGDATPMTMSGMGGAGFGFGMGSGSGAGSGSGGGGDGGTAPFFGFKAAPGNGALVGTFYDLKQTRGRKPVNADFPGVVREFTSKGWSSDVLSRFYRATRKMYATQIFIPELPADEAPKAFEVERNVQPTNWLIHYKGRVSPPADGKYRFVSAGDDAIVVRIGDKVVCDGSLPHMRGVTGWEPKEFSAQFGHTPGSDKKFAFGDWIEMKGGEFYNMEVLIGEHPGGVFLAFLMVEKDGTDYKKRADGCPILPLFRLSDAKPPAVDPSLIPEYEKDGALWRVEKQPISLFSEELER